MNRREFLASVGILGIGAFMPSHEQQHYWTGSEWLAGDKMQVPESGVTRLFSVATTSGWRVELGDPTYPIRYWDGTESVFTVDASGDIVARTITLYPVSGGTAGVVTVDAASAGNEVHAFSFIDNTGGERFYVRAGAGEIRTNSSIEIYATFGSPSMIQLRPDGTIALQDVSLYRDSADVLALGNDAFQLEEMTAPAAPAANQVRLFAQDNGAGKTQLMARFSSGVAQQVAIQP